MKFHVWIPGREDEKATLESNTEGDEAAAYELAMEYIEEHIQEEGREEVHVKPHRKNKTYVFDTDAYEEFTVHATPGKHYGKD